MMRILAQMLRQLIRLLSRAAHALERTLPALMPAAELDRLVRVHYTARYASECDDGGAAPEPAHLTAWESRVVEQYKIETGRLLILGAGWGRESIALARRGLRVAGLDINHLALRKAGRLARSESLPAAFQQGTYLALPYRPASFDCVLLSCNMYSAIPGARPRQAWLRSALQVLKPDGKVVVSFLPCDRRLSRLRAWSNRFNQWLARLPGANHDYQAGDICYDFHYLHEFQDRQELQDEVERAGARVIEINWDLGYAVLGG